MSPDSRSITRSAIKSSWHEQPSETPLAVQQLSASLPASQCPTDSPPASQHLLDPPASQLTSDSQPIASDFPPASRLPSNSPLASDFPPASQHSFESPPALSACLTLHQPLSICPTHNQSPLMLKHPLTAHLILNQLLIVHLTVHHHPTLHSLKQNMIRPRFRQSGKQRNQRPLCGHIVGSLVLAVVLEVMQVHWITFPCFLPMKSGI